VFFGGGVLGPHKTKTRTHLYATLGPRVKIWAGSGDLDGRNVAPADKADPLVSPNLTFIAASSQMSVLRKIHPT